MLSEILNHGRYPEENGMAGFVGGPEFSMFLGFKPRGKKKTERAKPLRDLCTAAAHKSFVTNRQGKRRHSVLSYEGLFEGYWFSTIVVVRRRATDALVLSKSTSGPKT